jgi:ureidoglycolate lyase
MPTPAITPRHVLAVTPLTAASFARFGDVIEVADGAPRKIINAGFAVRVESDARLDTDHGGGHAALSIFRTTARTLPLQLSLVERHRLGSQLFMPLARQRFLVVVAAAGAAPGVQDLHAFSVAPGQGLVLARGTWHHPLLALDDGGDFLVIERGGAGAEGDCEVHDLAAAEVWIESI